MSETGVCKGAVGEKQIDLRKLCMSQAVCKGAVSEKSIDLTRL